MYRVFSSVEHPADFEWRFTEEAISRLQEVATEILPADSKMNAACLGCPSLFVAGTQDLLAWNWRLFDRRAHLLNEVGQNGTITSCDLSKPLLATKSYDLAFVDPPWYNLITKYFLANASRVLKPGGIVFLSMPATGTRTTAEFDLNEILSWCPTQGLSHEATVHSSLPYSTPYFERMCLQAAGFSADVPSWRRGDLIVLRVDHREQASASPFENKQTCPPVHEVWIKGVKFVVIGNSEVNATPSEQRGIEPVWINPILPSVSTRFPGRCNANIITSGNRFFHCTDAEYAVSHLTALAAGCENGVMIKNDIVKEVLTEVVAHEISEVREYNEKFR